jgi:hypothetical protein
MEQTAQATLPPAIQPEGSRFWRRFLPWITTVVVVAVYVLVKVLLYVKPETIKMHLERYYSMAPPGDKRKTPEPALLTGFPALPTGWHGTPIPLFPVSGRPSDGR